MKPFIENLTANVSARCGVTNLGWITRSEAIHRANCNKIPALLLPPVGAQRTVVGGDDREGPVALESLAGQQPEVNARCCQARSGRQDDGHRLVRGATHPCGRGRDLVVDIQVQDRGHGRLDLHRPEDPAERCIELKSLKLYLWSYRNDGVFYERAVNQILDHLVAASDPRRMTVVGLFNPRGGITATIRIGSRACNGISQADRRDEWRRR